MAVNITDVEAFTSPVQSIADGEALAQAQLLVAPQGLANRTAYLRRLVLLSGGAGIRRIWTVADVAALKAVTTHNDGDVIYVESRGIYMFDSASTQATLDPIVVTPTAGGGRWFLMKSANMIVDEDAVSGTSALTQAVASYSDITSSSITLTNAEVGDVLRVSAFGVFYKQTLTTDAGTIRLVYTENGGSVIVLASAPVITGDPITTPYPLIWHGRAVIATAGPVVVKLQWISSSGTIVAPSTQPRGVSAMLVRP